MTATQRYLGLGALVLFVGAMGCASTPQPAERPANSTATLSDAQIAAIVATANQIDIDNGALAMENADSEEVRQFAKRMMEDHASVNEAALELVNRLGVTPEATDTSRGLTKSARETRESMRDLTGAEFDRAYVDNEVTYHAAVIQMLDETLIPSAQNAELKTMLVDVRPAFIAHLDHARSLQNSLGGAAPSSYHGH